MNLDGFYGKVLGKQVVAMANLMDEKFPDGTPESDIITKGISKIITLFVVLGIVLGVLLTLTMEVFLLLVVSILGKI